MSCNANLSLKAKMKNENQATKKKKIFTNKCMKSKSDPCRDFFWLRFQKITIAGVAGLRCRRGRYHII